MPKTKPDALRAQLMESLRGGGAHADARTALAGIPETHWGVRPHGLPHSPWQLVEHMRLALQDLHAFSTDPNYIAPEWPRDYWPSSEAPPDAEAWRSSSEGLVEALARLEALVEEASTDLLAPISWGQGQNLLRETLLALMHTSYHIGQLVVVRRLQGNWKH